MTKMREALERLTAETDNPISREIGRAALAECEPVAKARKFDAHQWFLGLQFLKFEKFAVEEYLNAAYATGQAASGVQAEITGHELAIASKAMRGTVWIWIDERNIYSNPTFRDWEAMANALAESRKSEHPSPLR